MESSLTEQALPPPRPAAVPHLLYQALVVSRKRGIISFRKHQCFRVHDTLCRGTGHDDHAKHHGEHHQAGQYPDRVDKQVEFLLYVLLEQVLLPAPAKYKMQNSVLGRCKPSHSLSAVNLAPNQIGKGGDKADSWIYSHGIYSFYHMRKDRLC